MSIDKYDQQTYKQFTKRSEIDKALHTLEGLLKGISIDRKINAAEVAEIQNWIDLHENLINHNPFTEMATIVRRALNDGYISEEEKKDILWVCDRFITNNIYFDMVTSVLQILQGIVHGIMADNRIEKPEIEALKEWLLKHDYLKGYYPYDDIYSVITQVLSDGIITPEESNLLKAYFSEFIDTRKSYNLNDFELQELRASFNISGVCSVCPTIAFEGRLFCFTGESVKAPRSELKSIIESRGGIFRNSVSKKTSYLIVGGNGSKCWTFACYGRKVEQAVALRKAGHGITIVHENDFWSNI